MKKSYFLRGFGFVPLVLVILVVASCKKDKSATKTTSNTTTTATDGTPAKLGLWESDSSIYKLTFIDVPTVGTSSLGQYRYLIFDTGSGGMVIDADGLLPASMITDNGFNFTGDSVVYNGITVTKDTASIVYGDDNDTESQVYGNLAYANVTIDQDGGNILVKRLPFFLYYKALVKGKKQPVHDFDVFGVNEEYDVTFEKGTKYITSPFSYYDPGTGLDKGFKMAALGTSNFSLDGTYVNNVITLGLSSSDTQSGGFSMTNLTKYTGEGYLPIVPGVITYSSSKDTCYMLFDSGTEPDNYIQDTNAKSSYYLPSNTAVSATTTGNFTYSFTTTDTDYITYIENPKTSGSDISVFSIEYFLNNEFMLDFTTHQLGLKNN